MSTTISRPTDPRAVDLVAPSSPGPLAGLFDAVRDGAVGFGQLVGVLLVIQPLILLSLMPLSVLLLLFPAAVPDESVITDTAGRLRLGRDVLRRLFSFLAGLATFVALVVSAAEVVIWLGMPRGPLTYGWGLLIVYALDLSLLLIMGRVPLAYNLRNLRVRWVITALTGVVFTAVVAILTVLLAFVNGMYQLTGESGQPANVIVMSDGSTDEIFSNLGYNDVALIERETATLAPTDRPLARPARAKRATRDGVELPLASRETYCIINRPVDNDPTRKQFVQVRGVVDPAMSGSVHGLTLAGGAWFSEAGVRTPAGAQPGERDQIEAVLGTGVARELGKIRGQATLNLGDAFQLGDREWVVVGFLASDGTTFGSEIWGKQAIVAKLFNKNGYTSLVVRLEDDGPRAEVVARAQAFAHHLNRRFSNPKVNAQTELEYFGKQSENNKIFLYGSLFIAAIMALGGTFGAMNTMFAAVAARVKDIGVLRILGFKRWQVLVSFLLESLTIAALGGGLGLLIGLLFHGLQATSVISGNQGGGGGKTVILTLIVDAQVLMAGATFTLVMGRLGGLIPALSATRMKLLDTLR